jgi:flagellar basal body P-ring formation protein FlgA
MSLAITRTAICVLCMVMVTPAAAQMTGSTPTLKREVTMTGEIVRIGDLVDRAGALSAMPIFRAP